MSSSIQLTTSSISGFVKGLSKNQDRIFYGTDEHLEKGIYDWGVLLDGHGSNDFINIMSSQNWREIMMNDDPWNQLHSILLNINNLYTIMGGSTLLMIKSFSNHIETISVGDSEIIIHKNGIQIYKSTPHNLKCSSERERVQTYFDNQLLLVKKSNKIPLIRSSNTLQVRPSEYLFFDPNNRNIQLAMSQSIGHHNITGYQPEKHIEYFNQEDTIQCILGSDGLFEMMLIKETLPTIPELLPTELEDLDKDTFDMLTMSAEELVLKAEHRWKQEWKYMWHIKDFTKIVNVPYNDYDDISAIVWRKK